MEVVVPPAADGSEVTADHVPSPARTFRLVLLISLLALALLCVVSLVALTSSTTDAGSPVERFRAVMSGDNQRQDEREAVMAQTEQFMLRMGTFGPDLLDDAGAMPEYRERVREVITPKFASSFDKEAATAEQLVAQAGVAREAEVFATGVSVLDSDSATALVAGSFTDSYPKDAEGEERVSGEPVPFRIEVRLVKADGEWLVDDFTPVSAAEGEVAP